MKKIITFVNLLLFFSGVVCSANEQESYAHAKELSEGMVNPGFYEKPDWFKQSFLDLQEDLAEANENNKRIMLYFHQDGCPYCKKLLDDNFNRNDIVEKMKQHYDLLEINMWGDKSVTTPGGDVLSEKEFSRQMKVMFTPTLIVLDKKGSSLFRMNGYYAPDKFSAVLDYLLQEPETEVSGLKQKSSGFTEYFRRRSQGSGALHMEKFIYQGNDLQKLIHASSKPVAILFEQGHCLECDELHGDLFRRMPVYKKLRQFTIAQVNINSSDNIITPEGKKMSQMEFAKAQNIQYTPSMLFYENGQASDSQPVFRSEAYLKSFHLQAILDYISSKAYLTEPEFQRFVQRRADKMRAEGIEVDLWE